MGYGYWRRNTRRSHGGAFPDRRILGNTEGYRRKMKIQDSRLEDMQDGSLEDSWWTEATVGLSLVGGK